MKHVHVWINSQTTHAGQVCKICGVRPIINLVNVYEVEL